MSLDADALALEPPDAPLVAFGLPSIRGLAFGAGLFLLALLLQPAVPSRTSRTLRLVLFPLVACLAFATPFRWRFEPFDLAIPANFRWAIFAPYGVLKALEWGTMGDRARTKELAWVGFDGREEERARDVVDKVRGATVTQATHEDATEASTTAVSTSNGLEVPDPGARKRSPNGLPAPTPIRPVAVVPPALDTPPLPTEASHLPTPSPSPPFDAVNPPSISSLPLRPTSSISPLAAQQRSLQSTTQRHHPLSALSDAAHLLSSLRGIGYTWGPPLRTLARPAPDERAFVRRAAREFVRAHVVSTACVALQVLERDGELAPLLARRLPFLSPAAAQLVAATLSRLGIGASLHAQMNIGAEGVSLALYGLHCATNAVLALVGGDCVKWRSRFDVREYPPLFDRPFLAMGKGGLAGFWGHRWHALFRDVFTSVGYRPVTRLVRKAGLPKKAGQFAAVVVVFALSGWMHWQALVAARYGLAPRASTLAFAASHHLPSSSLYPAPYSTLSFVERHGTWVFFLVQPVAVTLENVWLKATGRRIGGWPGRAWVALCVVVFGQATVGKSWLALGLVHGLPPVRLWSWHRWLLPVLSLAPMPLFMRTA